VNVSRRITPIVWTALVCVVFAATPGCGGSRARSVETLDGVKVGKRVRMEGTLSLRGSTPFTTPVLETELGGSIPLDAKAPGLLTQLRGLAGMRCAVEGSVLPYVDESVPRLSATRYDLLPLPDGTQPILGLVSLEDGECVVTTDQGKRYWIRGDLVAVVSDYNGARVWIVGDTFDTDATNRPKKSTPLTATGYGVVDETPVQ
jgi:hypothetical protein